MKRKQQKDLFDQLFAPLLEENALAEFGLASGATHEDVMAAFRKKVHEMSDGQGGYTGDMNKLVDQKEEALRYLGEKEK